METNFLIEFEHTNEYECPKNVKAATKVAKLFQILTIGSN